MALTVAELLVRLHGDTASFDAAMASAVGTTRAVADSLDKIKVESGAAGASMGFLGEETSKATYSSVNLLTALDATASAAGRMTENVVLGAAGLAALGHEAEADVAKVLALSGALSHLDNSTSHMGARFGGRFAGFLGIIAAVNQVAPLTTIIGGIVAAAGGLVGVGVALGTVAVATAAVLYQWGDLLESANGLATSALALRTYLFESASKAITSLGGGLSGGIANLEASLKTLIDQAMPMLVTFVKGIMGAGQHLSDAFLSPQSGFGGLSLFQKWGQVLADFVHGGGNGLLHWFVAMQPVAMALVTGIANVFKAFGQSAIFSAFETLGSSRSFLR